VVPLAAKMGDIRRIAIPAEAANSTCPEFVSGAESRTFSVLAAIASAYMSNPCLSCGACCACFRASFHWLETTAAPGGVTPAELTAPVTRHRVAMRGTDQKNPRCIALDGAIGHSVRCNIYEWRATPGRDFQASWVDGQHNERCDRARAVHGLSPLPPPSDAAQVTVASRIPVPDKPVQDSGFCQP
jgi:Fe-S-cluster containining protein